VLSYLSEGMMRGIYNAIDTSSMAFFYSKLLLEKKKKRGIKTMQTARVLKESENTSDITIQKAPSELKEG